MLQLTLIPGLTLILTGFQTTRPSVDRDFIVLRDGPWDRGVAKTRTDDSETISGVIFSFWNSSTRLPKLCCLRIAAISSGLPAIFE